MNNGEVVFIMTIVGIGILLFIISNADRKAKAAARIRKQRRQERQREEREGIKKIRQEIALEKQKQELTEAIEQKKKLHIIFKSDKAIKYDQWV